MDKRDSDLDALLGPFRTLEAHELQLKRWKMAVQRELRKNISESQARKGTTAAPFIAALVIGFVLGGVTWSTFNHFRPGHSEGVLAEQSESNATTEYIYAKSE